MWVSVRVWEQVRESVRGWESARYSAQAESQAPQELKVFQAYRESGLQAEFRDFGEYPLSGELPPLSRVHYTAV